MAADMPSCFKKVTASKLFAGEAYLDVIPGCVQSGGRELLFTCFMMMMILHEGRPFDQCWERDYMAYSVLLGYGFRNGFDVHCKGGK
jgi:hypothetical protein